MLKLTSVAPQACNLETGALPRALCRPRGTTPLRLPSVPEEAPIRHRRATTTGEAVPTRRTVAPAAFKPAARNLQHPSPLCCQPAAPAILLPGMFRKSTLTYRPPRIEEYLGGSARRQPGCRGCPKLLIRKLVPSRQLLKSCPCLSSPLPGAPARPGMSVPKPSKAEARSPDPHGYGSHPAARHSAGNH